jgi:hypothetical protein
VVAVAHAAAVLGAALAAPGHGLEGQRLLLVEVAAPAAQRQAAQVGDPALLVALARASRGVAIPLLVVNWLGLWRQLYLRELLEGCRMDGAIGSTYAGLHVLQQSDWP